MAERFLKLTPDEIYELAHGASQGAEPDPRGRALGDSSPGTPETSARPAFLRGTGEEPDSFRHIVEMVTEALTREMELPDFETWRTAYEAAPETFDEDLLGLWREGV